MPQAQATIILSGQTFSPTLIDRINQLVASQPDLTRAQLSREVCQWLDWKNPRGKLQDSSCSCALKKLADQGLITLPARRHTRSKPSPRLPENPVPAPHKLPKTLRGIKDLRITPIERLTNPGAIETWNWLMINQHPQGDKPIMGRQVRYLIESEHGILGAAAFNSASWRLAARDQFIGWSEPAREDNLQKVVSMSRFLIREEVKIDNLASHLLAQFAKQVPLDWQRLYGEEPLLLESFIDPAHFSGSCYRAANWIRVGQTKGRGRQDRNNEKLSTIKEVYLYPLTAGWKADLCASPRAPQQGAIQPLNFRIGLNSENGWADLEFEKTELSDQRLNSRAARIAENRFLNPGEGTTGLGRQSDIKGAYRFFESERDDLTIDNILAGHFQCTTRRMAAQEKVVLCSQDTTRLNYDGLKETTGLGAISGNQTGHQAQGLHLHSTMATTTTGLPLGLIDVQCWARLTKAEKKKRKKEIEATPDKSQSVEEKIQQKESYRWLYSYEQTDLIAQRLEGITVVNISDREGDIYELFSEAKKPHRKAHLLVRANHDRALLNEPHDNDTGARSKAEKETKENSAHIWPHLEKQSVAASIEVKLPQSQPNSKRKATLEIRYAKIKLKASTKKQANLPLWAVYVNEPNPPEGEPPVQWMLLTTIEITDAEEAMETVGWYCQRWKIEELHRVLKSGCRIEAKQLKTAEGLKRAIAIDLVVGWRILLLSKLSREHPELPGSVAFSPSEIEVLKIFSENRQSERQTKSSKKNATSPI